MFKGYISGKRLMQQADTAFERRIAKKAALRKFENLSLKNP